MSEAYVLNEHEAVNEHGDVVSPDDLPEALTPYTEELEARMAEAAERVLEEYEEAVLTVDAKELQEKPLALWEIPLPTEDDSEHSELYRQFAEHIRKGVRKSIEGGYGELKVSKGIGPESNPENLTTLVRYSNIFFETPLKDTAERNELLYWTLDLNARYNESRNKPVRLASRMRPPQAPIPTDRPRTFFDSHERAAGEHIDRARD